MLILALVVIGSFILGSVAVLWLLVGWRGLVELLNKDYRDVIHWVRLKRET